MNRQEELAAAHTAARPRLVRVAYAVLALHAEAEDVVSEVWLRLADADTRQAVLDVEGWATVAVARRALDAARSARGRWQSYVGPWLPEPIIGLRMGPRLAPGLTAGCGLLARPPRSTRPIGSPGTRASASLCSWSWRPDPRRADRMSAARLFGLPFPEVANAVGRTLAAVRQLAARARGTSEPRRRASTSTPESTRRRWTPSCTQWSAET